MLNLYLNAVELYSNTWTVKFQMFKLILGKSEEPEITLPTSAGSLKKQESSRKKKKIYFCFIDYGKAFDCVDHKLTYGMINYELYLLK